MKSTSSARQVVPSVVSSSGLASCGAAISAPPTGSKKKLFSDDMCGKNEVRHKLTVKPKDNQSTEEIKKLLKSKIDPVKMKTGIRTFKGLRMVIS